MADLDPIIIVPTFKHWYAYQLVYPWALLFVKASILALYYRIFTQTKFRYVVYAVSGLVTVQTIVVTFVNVSHMRKPQHLPELEADWSRLSNAARKSHGGPGRLPFPKDATTYLERISQWPPSTFSRISLS
jgi:hypothetical protein